MANSNNLSIELNHARIKLSDWLGVNMKIYLQLLKSWFIKKISREDFDQAARELLSHDSVHLHNIFLLALLNKCQSLGSTSLLGETNSNSNSHLNNLKQVKKFKSKNDLNSSVINTGVLQRFLPIDPLCQTPQVQIHISDQDDISPEFLTNNMLLPDLGLIHGRMIVSGWEIGLDNVEDNCIYMMMNSIEIILKNILFALASLRNSYLMRGTNFKYSIGSKISSFDTDNLTKWTMNDSLDFIEDDMVSNVKSLESNEDQSVIKLATVDSSPFSLVHKVSLFDLYNVLQTKKNLIPAHTVYTLNIERIVNRLWHPCWEEN